MGLLIFIFFVLLSFSAYLSALHIAFISQNEYSLLTITGENQEKLALLKDLYLQRENILVSIVTLNKIVNICATIICSDIISDYILQLPQNDDIDVVISIFVSISIILLFGEITPSIIGNAKSNSICYNSAGFLYSLSRLSKPFIGLLSSIKTIILKLIKKEKVNLTHPTTIEEIKLIGTHGLESGLIDEFGLKMISHSHYFNTLEVSDVMIPAGNVITLNENDEIDSIRNIFVQNMYSRIPVFNHDESDIIGIFNFKELCKPNVPSDSFKLIDHLQKPVFTPDSISIGHLFEKMRKEKSQMVIVLNEYGSFTGIVTMNDIMERIFGKIDDEYEDKKQSRLINKTKSINEATVEGSTSLPDLTNILKIEFEEKDINDFKTINGFLVNLKGSFLKESDELSYNGYLFKVLKIKNHFAEKIYIREL